MSDEGNKRKRNAIVTPTVCYICGGKDDRISRHMSRNHPGVDYIGSYSELLSHHRISAEWINEFPPDQRTKAVEMFRRAGHYINEAELAQADGTDPDSSVAAPTPTEQDVSDDRGSGSEMEADSEPNEEESEPIESDTPELTPEVCDTAATLEEVSFDSMALVNITKSSVQLSMRSKGLYRRVDYKKFPLLQRFHDYLVDRMEQKRREQVMSDVCQFIYHLLLKTKSRPDELSRRLIANNHDALFDFVKCMKECGSTSTNCLNHLKHLKSFVDFSIDVRQIKNSCVLAKMKDLLERISVKLSDISKVVGDIRSKAAVVPTCDLPSSFEEMTTFLHLPEIATKFRAIVALGDIGSRADYVFVMRYGVVVLVCKMGLRPETAENFTVGEFLVGEQCRSVTEQGNEIVTVKVAKHKVNKSAAHEFPLSIADLKMLQFYFVHARPKYIHKFKPKKDSEGKTLAESDWPFFISTVGTVVRASDVVTAFQKVDCRMETVYTATEIRSALSTRVRNADLSDEDKEAVSRSQDHDPNTADTFYVKDNSRRVGRSFDVVQLLTESEPGPSKQRHRGLRHSDSSDSEEVVVRGAKPSGQPTQVFPGLFEDTDETDDVVPFRIEKLKSIAARDAEEFLSSSGVKCSGKYTQEFKQGLFLAIPLNISQSDRHNKSCLQRFRDLLPQTLPKGQSDKVARALWDLWSSERLKQRLNAFELEVDFTQEGAGVEGSPAEAD